MLVLIGQSWLTAVEEDGSRRLDNPRDWVVQEIEAALARDVTVIPVLVDGARMPHPGPAARAAGVAGVPAGDQPAARVVRHRHHDTLIDGRSSRRCRPDPSATGRGPADRKVEQRLVDAWRQLRGEPDSATASRAGGHGPPTAEPAAPVSAPSGPADRRRGELPDPGDLVPAAVRSRTTWSDSLVPLVIMTVVTLGYLPVMWWSTRRSSRRPSAPVAIGRRSTPEWPYRSGWCWRWSTVNISSSQREPRSSGCCSTPSPLIPGGRRTLMLRARLGRAALWPAGAGLPGLRVSALLISAVQLA